MKETAWNSLGFVYVATSKVLRSARSQDFVAVELVELDREYCREDILSGTERCGDVIKSEPGDVDVLLGPSDRHSETFLERHEFVLEHSEVLRDRLDFLSSQLQPLGEGFKLLAEAEIGFSGGNDTFALLGRFSELVLPLGNTLEGIRSGTE
ncbi:hypothetical protein HUJ04_008124 [Dendroctonus ponderosae]|nr:hypothetical protein HUJ04_008124 [Dendroctonus ponderosae]